MSFYPKFYYPLSLTKTRIRELILLSFIFLFSQSEAQNLKQDIEKAYLNLENDPQLKYGTSSLSVLNAETGELVYSANGNIGLASASTLKTITSATAYYLLGKDFTWETKLAYSGLLSADGILQGDLIIIGGADPSFGSDRYNQTKADLILDKWATAVRSLGIKKITGHIITDDRLFGTQTMPGGWTWQDMGNYYGAGPSSLSWRENQFDLYFRAGRVGEPAELLRSDPEMSYLKIINEVKTGATGTGDNVYAYSAPYSNIVYLRGTYGVDLKKTISASVPDPAFDFAYRLMNKLVSFDIQILKDPTTARLMASNGLAITSPSKIVLIHTSPDLDAIVYWFNRKSVNLYGEHLVKTMAWKEGKEITTAQGVELVKEFWNKKIGVSPSAMNIYDGSGLSPANRITTMAMTRILQSVRKEPWFDGFYNSLPVYNNMKMKSGSISDVIAYTGYQTSSSGTPLVFSIIINNYNGSSSAMRQKIFKVLNSLK